MADCRVTCVKRTGKTYDSITHIGADTWCWRSAQAIASIEDKSNTFYVQDAQGRAEIGVFTLNGKKYLRTHADGRWADNLDALPACTHNLCV